MAETLQDLITKNAKNNEIEDLEGDYPAAKGELTDQSQATVGPQHNEDSSGDNRTGRTMMMMMMGE